MKLNCETILDFYSHKNKRILCQIKVNPKSGKLKNSCRCLSQEDWKVFDKKLKKLITTIDNWNNEECLNFDISPYIQVNVQKSNLTLKQFYKFFGAIEDGIFDDNADVKNFVLECLFDFSFEVPISSSIDSHEYTQCNEMSLGGTSCTPLSFVPCSLQKKNCDIDGVDTVKTSSSKDTRPPKPISEISAVEPPLTTVVIKSEAAIVPTISCDSNNHSDHYSLDLDKRDELVLPTKENFFNTKSNKKDNTIEDQKHCVLKETTREHIFLIDNVKEHEKRSTSENVFPEQLSKNNTEKNSKKKENYSDRDIKFIKKTVDENSSSIEKSASNNILEEIDKKAHTKLHKISSQSNAKEKENKKVHTVKGADIKSAKLLERSSREDEMIAYTKRSRIHSKKSISESDNEFECTKKFDKNIIAKYSDENFSNLHANESTKDVDKQPKATSMESKKSLRRSERSPSKPKRYIEEHHYLLSARNTKKHKYTSKNMELFGTDGEDDDSFENNNAENIEKDCKIKAPVFETPVSKKTAQCSSSSSSTKTKRSRDKSNSECKQEKRDMSKWLSKKKHISDKERTKSPEVRNKSTLFKALPLKKGTKRKSETIGNEDTENDSKPSASTPISLELPSKEELELIRNKTKLIQTENAKVRAELDKMRASPPKKVEILSLQNIPVDDILNTFSTYKSELDDIFENNRKKDYIKGHDGINHCFVIRLLQQNIQMKMLEKLTAAYSNSTTTTQATLFANALLPEWVIRVYMKKFNFTRQAAIDQIKAQEEFQLHMEDQSDSSFMFD